MKNKKIVRKTILILILTILYYLLNVTISIISLKIYILSDSNSTKFWVGEKHRLIIRKFPDNSNEKIFLINSQNKVRITSNRYLFFESSGKECLTSFTKINKIKSTICFNIYDTPELSFEENNPIRIEAYSSRQLTLNIYDYPKSNIKYESNYPSIVNVNSEGKIIAIRPGSAIITASGLDGKRTEIEVLSISNNGFINNDTLDLYNTKDCHNLMIVAHPDDETLWGGANLYKDSYFVVCLTNGFNIERANDYKNILKYTKNSGLILNYPDTQGNIQDDWSNVKIGMLKDLSMIINYKHWNKIVTYGPDGTTGHYHHKKTCEFVTQISKKLNKYNFLYYFAKFYPKKDIPKNLNRISEKYLTYKKREVSIYKSVKKTIYKIWFHFLPFENFILASKWKNNR